MAARVRHPLLPLALVAVALALLAGGCGTTFTLPTENTQGAVIAGQGTYQRIATWTGMTNIQDILLTPSGELYLLFQDDLARTGTVLRYPQSQPQPLSTVFTGLRNPTALCFGANRLFVLDQGDSTAARSDFPCLYTTEYAADVNPALVTLGGFSRPITDVSAYWHVREYLLDGTPAGGFSDTSFAWVNGIAADALGRVYVGGIIMYCDVDPFNDHSRTLEYRYRIRRYVRGTGDRFVVDGSWMRDGTYFLTEGTGFGSTRDPRGMQWASPQGAALYFADMGNNQVQRYGDPVGGAPSFKLDYGGSGADSMLLVQPLDVAVDSAGYVYVVDAGNQRVLRYDPDGNRVMPWGRVDRTPDEPGTLVRPVAVAADNRQVYIADRGAGLVLRYWRRD
jgi:DNA-binding beta-propeller fold protein YncE